MKCFIYLIDVQTILGLTCILLMLQLTKNLMKYAQKNDVFVYDFLRRKKIFQEDLNDMYKEEQSAFTQEAFRDFNVLLLGHYNAIPMKWVIDELDLNSSGVEYLSFELKDHNIRAVCKDSITKICSLVTQEIFAAIVNSTKTQALG